MLFGVYAGIVFFRNYYFCLVIVIFYICFWVLPRNVYLWKKIYLVNRLETNCRKSLIPFHAIWGVCWYNLDSFWGGRRAGCRRKRPLMCVWVTQILIRFGRAVAQGVDVCVCEGSQIFICWRGLALFFTVCFDARENLMDILIFVLDTTFICINVCILPLKNSEYLDF